MKETSLWSDTLEETPAYPDLPLPQKVDVVVLGAGYTGLSAALQLATSGMRVAILEQAQVGWGASSRNGGQVLTGLKHAISDVKRQMGLGRARELFQASLDSIACLEALLVEQQIDCDYSRCGHIQAAWKPAHYQAFEQEAETMARDFQHIVRLVPRSQQGEELGAELYHGLLVDERSGGLNPAKYVHGLAAAAQRAGALIYQNTPAAGIERVPGGFRVHTPHGVLACQQVFVATNGYTGAVTPWLQRRVIPIGSYIIASEPLPTDVAARLLPRRRMVFDSKNFLAYFRLSPDQRLVFGGRAAFFPSNAETVRQSAALLRDEMVQTFPELAGVKVEYAWGGTLGFTLDLYPHAGERAGLWYALGYAGHGVAMATYLGQQTARQMLGEPVENPFTQMPFPGVPLYRGNPWFLPLAAAWYKIKDWVG